LMGRADIHQSCLRECSPPRCRWSVRNSLRAASPSLGAFGGCGKLVFLRGWPAEFSHCVQEISEGRIPRKVPPVEYLRNLKFFDCATPSGRLRIHPYFGAAPVLGGICSPCLSATRSTHHPLLKAKARQQGTSDRCFTMQQFSAHRSARDNRRRALPGCRARHARWSTRHRRELEVSALITRRVEFRMRAEGFGQAAVEDRDLRRALRAAEKAGVSTQRVWEMSRNQFSHNTRI
jgi:hypothetical protein